MSLLIVRLPPGAPASYPYVTSVDGERTGAHGNTTSDLLPAAGRGVEVVAVVPATELSWHRVQLPRGIGPRSPRLRAILSGLLEDQLLGEASQLHLALGPPPDPGDSAWAAICARDWLLAHLQALEAAGKTVARIVPELWPDAGALQLQAIGQPEQAWLLASGSAIAGGVLALPMEPGALALLRRQFDADEVVAGDLQVVAEPAVAEMAEQALHAPVALIASEQRLLRAAQSRWNLAQGEFARTGAAWASRRLGNAWREFLHAPNWRPARWGIAVLLLAQIIGLNLWARQVKNELAARQGQIDAMLTETFPQVQLVVDAPLQMAREVQTLRRSTGAISRGDLEPMLGAVAQISDPAAVPTAFEFTPGQLRLKGLELPAPAMADAQARLRPLGYALQAEADNVVLLEAIAP